MRGRKLTTEEFIEKAKLVHGDKYEYSDVEYVGFDYKVKIFCKTCKNHFHQKPSSHIIGKKGCSICRAMRSSLDVFVKKAIALHGSKYDYSEAEYKSSTEKVKIKCRTCDMYFWQQPNNHLQGNGCPSCGKQKAAKLSAATGRLYARTTNEFIRESVAIHGNKFGYDLVEYVNLEKKVKIRCNACGVVFEQSPASHLHGNGCRFCRPSLIGIKRTISNDEFVTKAKSMHGDRYNYEKSAYSGYRNKVTITCNKCGTDFEQVASSHLSGCGCPSCSMSNGERIVEIALKEYSIEYETERVFKDCVYKNPLRFDFYLPNENTCIEYNGLHHYEPVAGWGGESKFAETVIRDEIKRRYCKNNGIHLIEIPYSSPKKEIHRIIKSLKL